MRLRALVTATLVFRFACATDAATPPGDRELNAQFSEKVHPFLDTYCVKCHSGEKPKGHFDISPYSSMDLVARDFSEWSVAVDKLTAKEMPPENAKAQPPDDARQAIVNWLVAVRKNEARKNAGDPGVVLARRLSNSEYDYTIRDLTGVDLRPAREFPVDPANQDGFDNSGESLGMSPTLMTKYLQAARDVANHMVLRLHGIEFAAYPMLVETDRDKYCVQQIVGFYHRQDTDYAHYFEAAWQFKNRKALGRSKATLADIAAANQLSAKYLATIWQTLETKEKIGPLAKLQSMWKQLPAAKGNSKDAARAGCERMRDYVVQLRAKLEPRFPNLAVKGIPATAEPFLMWKNRQYASHRMTYERSALQVQGETNKVRVEMDLADEAGSTNEFGPGATKPVHNKAGDPDLAIPAGQRASYEAAFAKFCAVFPDAFYVQERGRNYFDKTKDQGRLLSAGFHNIMGYFRDDQPLYRLVLDDAQQKQLDTMWEELDFIAQGCTRTYVQFYLNEAREARGVAQPGDGKGELGAKEITSEAMIDRVAKSYLARAEASSNQAAVRAVADHFKMVNETIRRVEQEKVATEPVHLAALEEFAARAYRRPLTRAEKDDLVAYYHQLREKDGLEHEDAMRDALVYVLMSPDFCYRIDLADSGLQPAGRSVGDARVVKVSTAGQAGSGASFTAVPLSDSALASRLSYFLWSSMPDSELLAHATAGDLHRPEVLVAQARRMLQDVRVRDLATEFGGNWLDFRRFEELNTVDRERFTTFNSDLRQAMFEEPVRFMTDLFQHNGSVLDLVYGDYTFVNPTLARHYGMPVPKVASNEWVRVDHAQQYGRGGILPMAVFLTKNAPGLRTSPVKRGYWVVRRVLGERIPPPPAVVPELPRDEAKMELPLRQMLARHREDPTCAACHARFDAMGLVFEDFGPIGEKREKDLAGHPVDAHATFPGGSEGTGCGGLRDYVRTHRQDDFVDNLCRKLLGYALNRSLIPSDDLLVEQMRNKLARDGYRFDSLVESIITSPQFLNRRSESHLAMKGD
jgi:hypothetical protein